jgi:hypothetical protein
VPQLGGGLGLGSESADGFVRRAARQTGSFDGNDPVQTGLAGPINDTHAAAANLLEQLIVTETAANSACALAWDPWAVRQRGTIPSPSQTRRTHPCAGVESGWTKENCATQAGHMPSNAPPRVTRPHRGSGWLLRSWELRYD